MRRSAVPFAAVLLCLAATASAQGVGGGDAAPAPPAGASCLPAELVRSLRATFPPVATRPGAAQVTFYADPLGGGTFSFGQTVTNYVDLDATTGLRDWNCGTVTYDGHAGNDLEIRDFLAMDAGVPVLCAAPGTVVHTHDGEYDRRTAWVSGATANDVVVQHADGSLAYYWHLRTGSVRSSVGQSVAAGDTLGMVGSSGFSSGPHLHFETHEGGAPVEEHAGSCYAGSNRWTTPLAYAWDWPFELFNHGDTTIPLSWATICERPPAKTHVVAGATLYSWLRSRNLRTTDLLTFKYYSPLGLWNTYSFNPSGNFTSSWWYVYWTMPTSPSLFGAWHLDILRNGALIATQSWTLNATPNQLPAIAPRTLGVRANDRLDVDLAGSDPDGSVFWHHLQAAPLHGTATLSNTRRHVLRYVPVQGFTGLDSLSVYATDDENANGPAAVIRFQVSDQLDVAPSPAVALEFAPPAPNPAGPATRFAFRLPAAGAVRLELIGADGRRVASWSRDGLAAGAHEVGWSELTAARTVPPGLYFARLSAAGLAAARRVIVLR
ncbi:MAG: peptidoglycan DD-metalloendopeptidase family protein [Candidatus Eisenbacteria bacterium]